MNPEAIETTLGPRSLAQQIMSAAPREDESRLWKIAGSWGTVGFANTLYFVEQAEREAVAS